MIISNPFPHFHSYFLHIRPFLQKFFSFSTFPPFPRPIFSFSLDLPPCGGYIIVLQQEVKRPLKINEVEALVGITKKNIRFYESEGLLSPRRNSANGYRDYGPEEVEMLRRIKLLRKLGVPLEEIRKMQRGDRTLGSAMGRHLIALARQQRDLETAMKVCAALRDEDPSLEDLDAAALLDRLEEMESEGTRFMDKHKEDTRRRRYVAPVVMALLMVALMAGCIWLLLWAFSTDPDGAPPLPLLAVLVAIPGAVALGVAVALVLRIREIGRGEEDDAKKY